MKIYARVAEFDGLYPKVGHTDDYFVVLTPYSMCASQEVPLLLGAAFVAGLRER